MFGFYTRRNSLQRFDRRRIPLLVLAAVVIPLLIFSKPCWSEEIKQLIQVLGFLLLAVCVAGRVWCSSFIAGRKIDQIVATGPYALSRHPSYLFSTIGAAGVGASFGMISFAVVASLGVGFILHRRAVEEERWMAGSHEKAYRAYQSRFPHFFPHSKGILRGMIFGDVRPPLRTFVDSAFFFLTIPCALLFPFFQMAAGITHFLYLP